MLFRSSVPFAVLCCLLLSLASPTSAQDASGSDVDKLDLIGQPVPYRGELVGGWRGLGAGGDALGLSPTTTLGTDRRGFGSTTLPPLGCRGVAPTPSGDPTVLLFPLDMDYSLVDFFGDGATGNRPAEGPDQHNDDDSARIVLPFEFPFYEKTYNRTWVNNNGNLTFGRSFDIFSPTGFPIPDTANTNAGKVTMVAPFFADVDTGNPDCPLGDVWYDLADIRVPGDPDAGTDNTLVVTWDNVGFFLENGDLLRESVQAIAAGLRTTG